MDSGLFTSKIRKKMEWNKCQDIVGLPEVDQDVELLIRPENLPFQYLSVVWDGKTLWRFANNNEAPWTALDSSIHFKEWSYIVKPPLPRNFKRYQVLEDGRHDFNMISYNDEEEYERNGYLHLFDMYLKVISHKSAKISCDFLRKINPYEKCPTGISRILTYEFKSTDNISFGIFEGVLRRNMPDNDPEFLKSVENFYNVEYPQQMKELKEKLIEEKKNEFIKKYGKKPSKYDIENIERDARHTINNGFEPPILVPGIYPEFNCVEVFEVGEKIEDKNLEDFISWMKSRDIFTVYHRLPNGTPVEFRHLKFKDWKQFMDVK